MVKIELGQTGEKESNQLKSAVIISTLVSLGTGLLRDLIKQEVKDFATEVADVASDMEDIKYGRR